MMTHMWRAWIQNIGQFKTPEIRKCMSKAVSGFSCPLLHQQRLMSQINFLFYLFGGNVITLPTSGGSYLLLSVNRVLVPMCYEWIFKSRGWYCGCHCNCNMCACKKHDRWIDHPSRFGVKWEFKSAKQGCGIWIGSRLFPHIQREVCVNITVQNDFPFMHIWLVQGGLRSL